ncbi:NADH-ubiquinone oxidoreductase-F iron-sulfur binding region domain-containing protein [Cryptosporangium sp. NPDC048952]|uniref:NADH-ubiquinone oxidoreductase-F iron-sulfur binding region domain-containing protein n=1 Tax=Cryptosporangium sp. NPDC048952 TaxID=3363961 RepID=UPI00371279C7
MDSITAWTSIRIVPGADSRILGADSEAELVLPSPEELLDLVDESGLLGRGGAAFPLGVKLRSVASSGRPAVVVANGEEGEPMSAKDRWLLRHRPRLVLDGLRAAAHAVGAETTYVYVSHPASANAIRDVAGAATGAGARPRDAASARTDAGGWGAGVEVVVVEVGAAYVAGEETAVVRAIGGGQALPTDKPPRPYEEGVEGRPTLVSNVETLANLAWLVRHGAHAFRSHGTPGSPGTFLATVTGGPGPALYELPHGLPFGDLLTLHGVDADDLRGALMGGYFAGVVNRRILDLTLDHETARRFDTGLGCGAIALLTTNDCAVAVAASVLAYFDRENAGQCGSCFNGTAAMSAVTAALRDGVAEQADVDRLARWSVVLRGRGACGTLDGATNVAASLLREFPSEVEQHLDGTCTSCNSTPYRADKPFEVTFP